MRAGPKVAVLGSADVAVLAGLRPHPARLLADIGEPHAWVGRVGADAALATLAGAALWLAALWLAIGLTAAAATRLPGTAGRVSARIGDVLLPRAVRSVAAGSAGLGVLLSPVAALADHGPEGGTVASHNAVAGDRLPAPAWPIDPSATPAPPARPATDRVPATPSPTRTGSAAPESVTVRAGDSLWLIAARGLGPRATDARVAAAWPRWFAANRPVIGPDPALVRPGQVLHPPTSGDPSADEQEARP